MGGYVANLYFVNPLINPGSVDYLDWEINDLNFISFNEQEGKLSIAYIEDYTI